MDTIRKAVADGLHLRDRVMESQRPSTLVLSEDEQEALKALRESAMWKAYREQGGEIDRQAIRECLRHNCAIPISRIETMAGRFVKLVKEGVVSEAMTPTGKKIVTEGMADTSDAPGTKQVGMYGVADGADKKNVTGGIDAGMGQKAGPPDTTYTAGTGGSQGEGTPAPKQGTKHGQGDGETPPDYSSPSKYDEPQYGIGPAALEVRRRRKAAEADDGEGEDDEEEPVGEDQNSAGLTPQSPTDSSDGSAGSPGKVADERKKKQEAFNRDLHKLIGNHPNFAKQLEQLQRKHGMKEADQDGGLPDDPTVSTPSGDGETPAGKSDHAEAKRKVRTTHEEEWEDGEQPDGEIPTPAPAKGMTKPAPAPKPAAEAKGKRRRTEDQNPSGLTPQSPNDSEDGSAGSDGVAPTQDGRVGDTGVGQNEKSKKAKGKSKHEAAVTFLTNAGLKEGTKEWKEAYAKYMAFVRETGDDQSNANVDPETGALPQPDLPRQPGENQ